MDTPRNLTEKMSHALVKKNLVRAVLLSPYLCLFLAGPLDFISNTGALGKDLSIYGYYDEQTPSQSVMANARQASAKPRCDSTDSWSRNGSRHCHRLVRTIDALLSGNRILQL
jgi:hypothetical protein